MPTASPSIHARDLTPWRSLGFRLSVIVVLSVLCAVGCIIGFFLVQDFRQTVDSERSRLGSSAAAFAAASSKAVAAKDRRGALEVIRGIRGLAHVDYADVTLSDGRRLAEIGTSGSLVDSDQQLGDGADLSIFLADKITAHAEIRNGGETIGWISIHADVRWLRDRFLGRLLISMLFCGFVLAMTVAAAWWLIARIVRPLRHLADEFADIGRRSDLSKRLAASSNDEVGVLSRAFNDMFSRIDERDKLLQRHRETLEETVLERTAQMRAAKEEAERANAAKSEFLATVSHEIRTPMSGMLVMAEMLSNARLPEMPNRYAQIILRSGRGMLNILNDILDLSKIESGRLDLESIPFSLDTLVEDVAGLFAERAREKSLSIALVINPDVPREVVGDPVRINQILTNLVNNALKFTTTGGVTVELRCLGMNSDKSKHRIGFFVRDTGIGIAENKIDKLFSRFRQADSTISRKFGGTGLGLAISKQLVEAMGGTVRVTSEPQVGSCFSFDIDLVVTEPAPPRLTLIDRVILLLDRNPITRSATVSVLSDLGAIVLDGDHGTLSTIDLVLARQTDLQNPFAEGQNGSIPPVVFLREADEIISAPSDCKHRPAGEIAVPLRRTEVEKLVDCILRGDFSPLCPAVIEAERDQSSHCRV